MGYTPILFWLFLISLLIYWIFVVYLYHICTATKLAISCYLFILITTCRYLNGDKYAEV